VSCSKKDRGMENQKPIGDLDASFEDLGIVQFGALKKEGIWNVIAIVSFGAMQKSQVVAECSKSLMKATASLVDRIKVMKGYE